MIAPLDSPIHLAVDAEFTLEEFAALPTGETHYELVDGRLLEKPMSDLAALVITNLGDEIAAWRRRTGAGIFFIEQKFQYLPQHPRTVRVPDGAFISGTRLTGYRWGHSFLKVAPDLAVEVISPSDIFYDVDRKLAEFFEAGVRRAWIINPDIPSVRVHRSFEEVTILRPGDELVDEEVLPGFRCPVDALFVRPGQQSPPPSP